MNPYEFCPDPNKKQPIYEQLYRFLIAGIKNGQLKGGEKLPSKRQMAELMKLSVNTIETAYGMLAAEGYIKAKPKSGFYICSFKEQNGSQIQPLAPSQLKPRPEAKEKTQATYLYDFHTGAVDTTFFPYATWAKITKEIMADNRELLNHGHPQGDIGLREAICQYIMHSRGIVSQPEQIVVGAGSEYLIGLIVQMLAPKAVFALENPGYAKNHQIIRNHGRKVLPMSLDENGMLLAQLEKSGANIAYITPSHQFPMGMTMPITRRMELLAWSQQEHDRYIIEDDYDSEFRFSGRPIPALKGLENADKVIYLSTFSKSVAPSIRIAFMVLPPGLLTKYQRDFSAYACSVSRFEQHCLYRFLRDGHFNRHLNRMRTIYRGRKDKLLSELDALPQRNKITIIGENAGMHLLLQIANGMPEAELSAKANAVGVKVYGLSTYCWAAAAIPRNLVVLGYAALEQGQIETAVRLLAKAWF